MTETVDNMIKILTKQENHAILRIHRIKQNRVKRGR